MWKAIKSYIWWTHPRGNLPYDVMVTVILAFIFISPHFINFNDSPAPATVGNGSVYLVPADQVSFDSEKAARQAFAKALKPTAGRVSIERWESLHDEAGNIAAYRVFVKK
jgi:hypothetical protein